jgi:phosphoserine phosphatase
LKRMQKHKDAKALAVLDMDGTLLEFRSIDVLCQHFGLENQLGEIDRKSHLMKDYEISKTVAQLFSGIKATELEKTFDGIAVANGAKEFITLLRQQKFLTAIITDSYNFLASKLAEKLEIDIVWGNTLEIIDGVITGRIIMPLGWEKKRNCSKKAVCKLHAMRRIAKKHGIGMDKTLAIGDSKGDLCMIEEAAVGVAFRPKDTDIIKIADLVIYGDFLELAEELKGFLIHFQ